MGAQIENGKAKSAGIIGIILLIFGLAICICGFVWISYGGSDGTGLWSGIGLVIAGILGIVAWPTKSKIAVIFMLVLCILEIIICAVQCIFALLIYFIWQIVLTWVETSCHTINNTCQCSGGHSLSMAVDDCSWVYTIEAIFLCVLILSGIGAIVALAGAIIGCMGACCGSPAVQNTTVIVQQPVAMVPQNTVYSTHGQQGQSQPPEYSQNNQTYQTKQQHQESSVHPPGVVNTQNSYPMADHKE